MNMILALHDAYFDDIQSYAPSDSDESDEDRMTSLIQLQSSTVWSLFICIHFFVEYPFIPLQGQKPIVEPTTSGSSGELPVIQDEPIEVISSHNGQKTDFAE